MASGSSKWREINSNGPLGGLSGCTNRQIKPKVRQKNSIFRRETAFRMPDVNKVYRVVQYRGLVVLHQIEPSILITVQCYIVILNSAILSSHFTVKTKVHFLLNTVRTFRATVNIFSAIILIIMRKLWNIKEVLIPLVLIIY